MDWKRRIVRYYKSGLGKEENLTSGLEEVENLTLQEWTVRGGKFGVREGAEKGENHILSEIAKSTLFSFWCF